MNLYLSVPPMAMSRNGGSPPNIWCLIFGHTRFRQPKSRWHLSYFWFMVQLSKRRHLTWDRTFLYDSPVFFILGSLLSQYLWDWKGRSWKRPLYRYMIYNDDILYLSIHLFIYSFIYFLIYLFIYWYIFLGKWQWPHVVTIASNGIRESSPKWPKISGESEISSLTQI